MGRPSLAEQRTVEILDAFERCVGRYGLHGSSLDRIAEVAGMKRSILRHYVGNRDELVLALARRVIAKFESFFDSHLEATEDLSPVEQLVTYLFPDTAVSSAESVLVIESLIAEGGSCPEIREMMKGYVERLVNQSAKLLRQAYPEASRRDCWSVAYGIVSICFNQESLTPLELPPRYLKAARATADLLIRSLEQPHNA